MAIKLRSVRSDTNTRFEDIQLILDLLNEEKKNGQPIPKSSKVDCQLILKSSIMLMIYNVIEGTMSNLLTEFFDIIVMKKISINNLPNQLQITIYTYYLKNIGEDPKKLKEFRTYDEIMLCDISYLNITKYLKLFSGNLDSRQIRSISKKLGINLPSGIDEPILLTIKNNRNKLAHGETRFRNTCQDMTTETIIKMCSKVKLYLENVITSYENFLETL